MTVQVGPGVFIPRPETEGLLEWASAQPLPPHPMIVDLCTGSGALALALAKSARRPHRRRRRLRRRVAPTPAETSRAPPSSCVAADVTDTALLPDLDGQVDLLVANPPYIPDGADAGTRSGTA